LTGWANSLMIPNSQGSSEEAIPAMDFITNENLGRITQFLDYYQSNLEEIDTKKNKINQIISELHEKLTLLSSFDNTQPIPDKIISIPLVQLQKQVKIMHYKEKRFTEREQDIFAYTEIPQSQDFNILPPPPPDTSGSRGNTQIVVVVYAKKPTKLSLNIAYVIMDASWEAHYDIRVKSGDPKLELSYYGNIFNRTDEDWNDVSVSLSTARPSIGGTPPELYTKIVILRVCLSDKQI